MVHAEDARKSPISGTGALYLLREVDHIYSVKNKDVVHVDLRIKKPDRATLLGLLLGPTGNLRAPTIRTYRTLVVGFHEDTYLRLLG